MLTYGGPGALAGVAGRRPVDTVFRGVPTGLLGVGLVESLERERRDGVLVVDQLLGEHPPLRECLSRASRAGGPVLRASVDVLHLAPGRPRPVGVVPGVGGTVANFVAYLQAKERSAAPETFGEGNIAGVIASEAANDAKDGGSLVPTLALGIPGSASTAVLPSALLLHGLTPGPLLIAERLDVVFVILLALVCSNVLTSAVGLVGSPAFAAVTRVPPAVLVPAVFGLAVVGAFAVRGRIGDVALMAGFGLLGYAMRRLDVSRIALVIGLVLGGLVEENFHRSLQISGGEYGIFVSRPLSIVMIVVSVAVLAIPLHRAYRGASSE